jgi:hypothetical protein
MPPIVVPAAKGTGGQCKRMQAVTLSFRRARPEPRGR